MNRGQQDKGEERRMRGLEKSMVAKLSEISVTLHRSEGRK
jgi:hypothetical protein